MNDPSGRWTGIAASQLEREVCETPTHCTISRGFCYERSVTIEYAAVFPTNEIGNDPLAIRDWAQTAEGLGYSKIIAYDHVLGARHDREPKLWGPYLETDPFHEPFVLFGYLAGQTQRIGLQVGVLIAPQRQTALIAKQAVQVDILSGGRLTLGLGTGWNYVEYEALGESFAERGRRLNEQVDVLRRLFQSPVIDYTGDYHRIDQAGILPLPVRGDIPIWFGGGSEASLRRAARVGDGFVFGSAGERVLGLLIRLRELLAEAGRDPDGFPVEAIIDNAVGPEEWRRERDAWAAAGGSALAVQTMDIIYRWRGIGRPNGFTSAAQHIDALRRFAEIMND